MGMNATVDQARSFMGTHGLNSTLAMVDSHYRMGSQFQITGIPVWILFDASGNVVERGTRLGQSAQSALDGLTG